MKKIFVILLMISFVFNVNADHKKPHIVWLSSQPASSTKHPRSPFWDNVKIFMEAAAEDLQIDFETIEYSYSTSVLFRILDNIVNSSAKPDMVIFHNHKKSGEKVLSLLEKAGVKSFMINSPVDFDKAGFPGGKYKSWVGGIFPDDEKNGFMLAEKLMDAAYKIPKYRKSSSVKVLAVNGAEISEPAKARKNGLDAYLKEDSSADFQRMFYTDWTAKWVEEMIPALFTRYPDVGVVWTASDLIAETILVNSKKVNKFAGEDYVIGGVDWVPSIIERIKKREIAVSIGGHFMEGALALIASFDLIKGYNLKEWENSVYRIKMYALTLENFDEFGDVVLGINKDTVGKIDFRNYSKYYNPKVKEYSFSLERLLNDLKNSMD